MAKKVKKTSSKVTKENLIAQNGALGEQVAGLQNEVMDLVEENEELNDVFDEQDDYIEELEDRNNALQSALVDKEHTINVLNAKDSQARFEMGVASRLIQVLTDISEKGRNKVADLEHDNHHLTIQLAAAKDKLAKYQSVYTDGIFRPTVYSYGPTGKGPYGVYDGVFPGGKVSY